MIFAFLLLAGLADWVPAHWTSADPKLLELVSGSGINCVLVDSARIDERFVRTAGSRGIAVAAVVRPSSDVAAGALRAVQMGANAIVLEGDFEDGNERAIRDMAGALPVIDLPSRQQIRFNTRDAIAGSWQGLWPGIEIEHGGKVMAGPTSNPWIDTNTGFLRFLRAAMNCALWIGGGPPAAMVVSVERYAIAISDAEAAGARWIVTLDDDLDRRLLAGDAKAAQDWKRITEYVRYFEQRREWKDYRPYSRMALLEDRDSGGLLSAGLLDLMYAQHVTARSIAARQFDEDKLDGVRTIINIEPPNALSAEQREALARFVRSGGVVLNPPKDWRFGVDEPGATNPSKKQLDHIQDIWEMLYNATARKNFGARTFNTAGILFNATESPDGKRLLIHLVNYTQYPADSITVHVLGQWKRARLYRPEGPLQELSVYPVKDGTGMDVENLGVTASVVIE